jgi:GNAT superfamily N-acetyltransferase
MGGAGIQSDQLLRPPTTTYHFAPGAVAVVVRESPDYWTGNLLVLNAPPPSLDPAPWLALWEREVAARSGAKHPLVQFELPWAARAAALSNPDHANVQWDTVLRAPRSMADRSGRPVRPITSELDWQALRGLMALDEIDPAATEEVARWQHQFLDWRLGMYRARVEAEQAALFGAWEDATLVGAVGVLWDAALGLARYQCVVTHPAHRRRGICSALLAQAHTHLADRGWPIIIVSDHDSMQERLYAGLGFEPVGLRGTWHLAEPA